MRKFKSFFYFCILGVFLAVTLFMITGVAKAKSIEIKLSSTLAPGSTLEMAADKFKELVEKASAGQITVVRYPSGELYDPKGEIEAVASGNIAMGVLHVAYVGGRSAVLEFISSFGAQGCWDSPEHYYRFIDNPKVQEIANSEFREKLNAELLAMLPYGITMVGNTKHPIRTIEDFKGLKLRTAGSAQANMYRALGVIPTEMSSGEVYMALQRGTIDGAMSGPARWYLSKWYEVCPYLTQDYSLPYMTFWLAINSDIWKDLTPSNQKILRDAAEEVKTWARSYVTKETEQAYDQLKASKKVKEIFFFDEKQVAQIAETVKPVMQELLVKRVGKEKADQLFNLLEQARK
jgi:C4-dicarboxylate-binding protein DctP